MPGRAQHLAKARSNAEFSIELLAGGQRLDWSVVAAFYSALHWVDAYLAGQQVHPFNHEDRERYL
jgi:hypothetical protein